MPAAADPDPIESAVLRWFRDADLAHPAVRLLYEIALERRRARTAAQGTPNAR